jgi:anthranilate/para-aminobenzoate synthase component II
MLIDLARNDIGRIARTGSVKVTEAFAIERYSHVMHIVSNVEGVLRDGMTNLDVLKATFPAGTLTGAPKIRAMELIDELEPVKRGVYGGACGYLSYAGDMDVAIAIRTGIVKDGELHVQAAAGIVADSVPELEWKETEAKARALLRAAELVEEGFLTCSSSSTTTTASRSTSSSTSASSARTCGTFRNDEIDVAGIAALAPDALVLSPGPCTPAEAGVCVPAIKELAGKLPILGVCLGHQAIGAALGGKVVRAARLMHGKIDEVAHDGRGVYAALPARFSVVRYHSLAIERASLPAGARRHLDRERR